MPNEHEMTEWTPEATEYLEGYLQMVGSLARAQGDEITAGLREYVRTKLEESAGPTITLDALRRVLAEVGSPEQILAMELGSPKSPVGGRTTPVGPAPPLTSQTAQMSPAGMIRSILGCIIVAFVLVILIIAGIIATVPPIRNMYLDAFKELFG
jgi:hypothetical protein